MQSVRHSRLRLSAFSRDRRRGGVIVLTVYLLVALFAFTAFVIDIGYITLSKAELGKTADGAALAAVSELPDGYGPGAIFSQAQVVENGRGSAVLVGSANEAASLDSTYVRGDRDVRFGKYQWDQDTKSWTKSWNEQPFNMAEVAVRRNVMDGNGNSSNSGDGPLKLFFAPVFGTKRAGTQMISTAAMLPAVGYHIVPSSKLTAGILPIALDVETWTALIEQGVGSDSYSYNPDTGAVSAGGDGILEVNLYPNGTADLPPGNRGTVDIGPTNNSTADLVRQILYGVNEADMAALAEQGVDLNWSKGPFQLNGDTGLSAGIKDELESIKGQPRAIPIFSAVSQPGNNAMYTIVKFVGVRIMFVQLTGKPTSKRVIIQPAPIVDSTFVTGNAVIRNDTMFGPASLIP
jgi:Flp pilus assembly protein TadG